MSENDVEVEVPFSDSLPEDLRAEPAFKDIGNVQDLARSYFNAQKMVGADKVAIPGQNADESDWGTFYDKLGRPSEAASYEFNPGEEAGSLSDSEQLSQFKDAAYNLGLSKKQAEGLFDWYNKTSVDAYGKVETALEDRRLQAEETLRGEFGNAYDERVGLASRVAQEFGGDEGIELLEESGLGNDPRVIKMFAKIGMAMAEDSIAIGDGNSSFTMTPDEAQREIASLQRDADFMTSYGDASNPTHGEAVTRMAKLFEYAHPDIASG